MKKTTKIAVIVCTLALVLTVTFALAACGGPVTYNYSKTTCDAPVVGSMLAAIFDPMFKGSSITVSDSELVLKAGNEETTMTVKKDGSKYILSGDFADEMRSALSEFGGSETAIDLYGTKSSDGFDIVMEFSISNSAVKLVIAFAK